MNNILQHKGYRFFQSSFDPDEKGTVLSVNHDFWGTWITYFGSFMLFFGLMAIMFSKATRFKFLENPLNTIKAKKAKLFGLHAPMRIKGTFSDIGVSIKPLDIVGAYFKFITSPLHAPFRRAFGKKAGEDMSELCGELLDREKLKAIMKEYNKKTPTLDEMYDF